jgi:hypothetical protein
MARGVGGLMPTLLAVHTIRLLPGLSDSYRNAGTTARARPARSAAGGRPAQAL